MRQEAEPPGESNRSRDAVPKIDTALRYSVEIKAVSCPYAEARREAARAILARLLARGAMKIREGGTRRRAA